MVPPWRGGSLQRVPIKFGKYFIQQFMERYFKVEGCPYKLEWILLHLDIFGRCSMHPNEFPRMTGNGIRVSLLLISIWTMGKSIHQVPLWNLWSFFTKIHKILFKFSAPKLSNETINTLKGNGNLYCEEHFRYITIFGSLAPAHLI